MQPARRRPWALHTGVLFAYLAAALVLSFPLLIQFGTHFPGGRDEQDVFLFLWNNWWVHHAVTELHARPYMTNFIYAPFVTDLRFTSSGLLYGLLSIPLMPMLGPVAVLNTQILATVIANGHAAFTLTRYLTKHDGVAVLSGLVLASSPAIDFHLLVGRPSCAALWPAILTLYFFVRLLDDPNTRTTAGLAVSGVATLVGDQEAALFAALWLFVLVVHSVASKTIRPRLLNARLLLRAAVAGLLAAVPAYVLYIKPFLRTSGYTTPGALEAFKYSFPVWLLWSPPLIWQVYGLLLPLSLASLVLLRRMPSLAPWIIGSLAFLILSFGPVIMGTQIPLPFSLMRRIPGLEQFRTPYRFQIPVAIGLTVAGAMVLSSWLARLRPRTSRLLLASLMVVAAADLLAHRLINGFRTQTMPAQDVYSVIARDTRDCVVLEVPVGVRTGTDRIGPGEALTFYQPVHRKRLINGSTSRMPLAVLEFYRSSPALMLLAGERPPDGDPSTDLRRLIAQVGIGYVVVHPGMVPGQRLQEILDLVSGMPGLQRLATAPDVIAFRVDGIRNSF